MNLLTMAKNLILRGLTALLHLVLVVIGCVSITINRASAQRTAIMYSVLSALLVVAYLDSFALPAPSCAQGKAGTATVKSEPRPQLAVSGGSWSGKAVFKSGDATPQERAEANDHDVFSFSVKNGALSGDGTIPLHYFCSNGVQMNASFEVDFGELAKGDFLKFTGPNTFRASFPLGQPAVTFNVVVVGTFLSSKSATGTVSLTASPPKARNGPVMELGPCKAPTIYSWTASPTAQ